MPDIFLAALVDMRAAIEGASPETLNQRPAGEDTNSIAVLAVHTMHSTRSWLAVATGAPLPARNRDDEFIATTPGAGDLLALIEQLHGDARQTLDTARDIDWTAPRRTHPRPPQGDEQTVPAAWALMHALEHLREHTGQIALTRQILDRR